MKHVGIFLCLSSGLPREKFLRLCWPRASFLFLLPLWFPTHTHKNNNKYSFCLEGDVTFICTVPWEKKVLKVFLLFFSCSSRIKKFSPKASFAPLIKEAATRMGRGGGRGRKLSPLIKFMCNPFLAKKAFAQKKKEKEMV